MSATRAATELRGLTLTHAALLGLLHGPAELLPISSSAHTELIPWLARWPEARLAPDTRKTLQVALHTGSVAGALVRDHAELRELVGGLRTESGRRRLGVIVLGAVAPGVAGLALEGPIERRLEAPAMIAAGLVAGSVAMLAGDRRAARRGGEGGARDASDAGPRDGLMLGLAQAAALLPGVSRSGATLSAARALGFSRAAAGRLADDVALPVIAGAAALKARRLVGVLRRGDGDPELRAGLAAATACAFVSSLACPRPGRGGGGPLWPYAAYRALLAAGVLARLRAEGTRAATRTHLRDRKYGLRKTKRVK